MSTNVHRTPELERFTWECVEGGRYNNFSEVVRGSLRPEIVQAPLRFMSLIGFPYVIAYHVDCRPSVIARILHGARHLPEILRLL